MMLILRLIVAAAHFAERPKIIVMTPPLVIPACVNLPAALKPPAPAPSMILAIPRPVPAAAVFAAARITVTAIAPIIPARHAVLRKAVVLSVTVAPLVRPENTVQARIFAL